MASTEVMNRAEESVDLSSLAPEHVVRVVRCPQEEFGYLEGLDRFGV